MSGRDGRGLLGVVREQQAHAGDPEDRWRARMPDDLIVGVDQHVGLGDEGVDFEAGGEPLPEISRRPTPAPKSGTQAEVTLSPAWGWGPWRAGS